MIDVARLQPGAFERNLSRRRSDFRRGPHPGVVGLGEGVERYVFLDRQRKMTPGDSERALDFVEAAQIRPSLLPQLPESRGQLLLIDVVGG